MFLYRQNKDDRRHRKDGLTYSDNIRFLTKSNGNKLAVFVKLLNLLYLALYRKRKIVEDVLREVEGGGEYSAPIITVGDFLSGKIKNEPGRIQPTYMDGRNVKLADPSAYLPDFVTSSIKGALLDFDKRISGFASPDAILTGAETRTSSPIRILRSQDTRLAIGYNNFYPAGEGAGYAGGITSAAIDGIKSALELIKNYAPYISG